MLWPRATPPLYWIDFVVTKTLLLRLKGKSTTLLWALDYRALAILRMSYGLILILDLADRAKDLASHYTDLGVAPRHFVIEHDWNPAYWSLHMMSGHWSFQLALFAVAGFAATCLTFGYYTKISSFTSWIFLTSLQTRNPMVLDGGDIYLRVVLFFCLFLPWGQRWSVDATRGMLTGAPVGSSYCGMAGVAYQLQLSLIYWFAAILKTGEEWRCEGSAVQYALMIDQLTTPLAGLLLANPAIMRALTYACLAFEYLGPLLFWLGGFARLAGVVGFCLMHIGFASFMHLGIFALVGASSTVGLLPGFFWDWLGQKSISRQCGGLLRLVLEKWPLAGAGSLVDTFPARPRMVLLVSLMLYLVLWNLRTIPGVSLPLPEGPGRFLRLDQRWSMFAPRPLVEDGWYIIEADRLDGTKVDIFRGGASVNFDKPDCVATMYTNARWRKLMMNLWMRDLSNWRLPYARYLTRQWNGTHGGNYRVSGFKIYFMLEQSLPDGEVRPPEKVLLWTHSCL